ncbi:hypothetical protein KIP69_11155 [Geobacter sulfurreducens]|uniref:Uncharacterized protein n=1 Tax=Geobacter sulfurreducens (strain ATCC 51573 / DSM 12127 / PCA) TaxID=243231 RepID=Q74AP8_GEOSL|nr:hypothetical protein [Geobacter sulfurreducens]AAR35680.1 hypothetical protein GSU2304 [Geobacter sulfurreducens PCA]ADI85062.1 hypothetical protein KN400_2250 [Geobacter sulfurreducens KN400]AJY68531.1 hypothetical protein RW64_02455 [Geobacter sulfurreducens]QVW34153.1 hypothetical protein KIP69_11155 [Geobacter sulfurreducens]UAC03013.1 hypothetical protein KVP06_11580 [Geobacter sulfurreducens]
MYRHGCLKRAKALLLLIVALHVTGYSLMLRDQAFAPLQEQITFCCSANIEADDAQTDIDDFKPPKHSFIDYTTYFCPSRLVPIYQPSESRLVFAEPFRLPPQVYPEISVPPQNVA